MDANPLQQLLLRGLGTTTLVADRLRGVTQEWVSNGQLDPNQASALVDDVLKALRGRPLSSSNKWDETWNATETTFFKTLASQAKKKWMNYEAESIDWNNSCVNSTGLNKSSRPAERPELEHPTRFCARHLDLHIGVCGLPASGFC
jgi:polyhydroxyalkanoate synthesis regulator phasin